MRRSAALLGLGLGLLAGAAAAPPGATTLEARTLQGRLSGWGATWTGGPDRQLRWWWDEAGGGSAWLRLGPLEAGALQASEGDEGLRRWSAGPQGGSGRWGLGLAAGPAGLWALQEADGFEAGAQAQGRWDAWRLAAGADRTWPLGTADAAPWSDRWRAGLTWSAPGGLAGLGFERRQTDREGGWAGRFRWNLGGPDLAWAGRLRTERPDGAGGTWSARSELTWAPLRLAWAGGSREPAGAADLDWTAGDLAAGLGWGRREGWSARLRLGGTAAALGASLAWADGLEAALWGREAGARWRGSWTVRAGSEGPDQVVRASWTEARWEASAVWSTRGWRLGWIGPGQTLELSLGTTL